MENNCVICRKHDGLKAYSALEWILECYKEKEPKVPLIAEKFSTYRLWDYREQVIDLLRRVCRSVWKR